MVIAIDGPAGSGKSTIAKALAKELGYYFLNTGSFYRAYTLYALNNDVDISCKEAVLENSKKAKIEIHDGSLYLDGINVEAELHTSRIDKHCSYVSSDPALRELANTTIRAIAGSMDIVTEGRDTTTVLFPDAEFKFYFDASPEVRAKRRMADQKDVSYEEILKGILERDKNDREKKVGALKIAENAVVIDTSSLTIEEVCEKVLEAMHLCISKN